MFDRCPYPPKKEQIPLDPLQDTKYYDLTKFKNWPYGKEAWAMPARWSFLLPRPSIFAVTYSFDLPMGCEFDILRRQQPYYVDNILEIIDPDTKNLIREAFFRIEELINIRFIEVKSNPQIPIFRFTFNQNMDRNTLAYSGYPEYLSSLSLYKAMTGIGFSAELFRKYSEAHIRSTVFHEIMHGVFSYSHLFDHIKDPFVYIELTKSFSVTNYLSELKLRHGKLLPVFPVDLMPLDILAAERRYGRNENIYLDDTIHNVDDYIYRPRESQPDHLTISSYPLDVDGVNTLDLSQIFLKNDTEITVNLQSFKCSAFGDHFMMMPLGAKFHNIIGSHYHDHFTLNELDNQVAINHAKSTFIYLDARNCGHDTIIGFNIATDAVYLSHLPEDNPYLLTQEFSGNDQKILFDINNSLTFKNMPSRVHPRNIVFNRDPQFITCRLFYYPNVTNNTHHVEKNVLPVSKELSHLSNFFNFPLELLTEVFSSFLQGAAITWIEMKIEDTLKKYHYTKPQIKTAVLIMQAVLMFISVAMLSSNTTSFGYFIFNSILSSGVSFFSYFVLKDILNFSDKNCLLLSNLAGIIANKLEAGLKVLTPLEIATQTTKLLASAASGYVGCQAGMWAHNKLTTKAKLEIKTLEHRLN